VLTDERQIRAVGESAPEFELADFPRLCRAVAEDGYLPRSFSNQGRLHRASHCLNIHLKTGVRRVLL
jgi:hypothetical protein